ncbi:MAG: isochorismatase family protein [Opitutales bacterium]
MDASHELGLLAIDLQSALLPALPEPERLRQRCRFALRAAQLFEIPVFFTEQVPEKLGPTDASLLDCLDPPPANVFSKSAFSAFGCEPLVNALDAAAIAHLLVIGIETPVCVYQSILDARRRDLDVTLLTDAIGARRPDDAAALLPVLREAGCHCLPSETVFYSLLGDAGHPRFRDFTQLVKQANTAV